MISSLYDPLNDFMQRLCLSCKRSSCIPRTDILDLDACIKAKLEYLKKTLKLLF